MLVEWESNLLTNLLYFLLFQMSVDTCLACYQCGDQVVRIRKCLWCNQAMYCSQKCQKTDWRSGHNSSCVNTRGLGLSVKVQASKIHGRGVFATKMIPKGTKICFFEYGFKIWTLNPITFVRDGNLDIVNAKRYFENLSRAFPDFDYSKVIFSEDESKSSKVMVGIQNTTGFGVGCFINDGAAYKMKCNETIEQLIDSFGRYHAVSTEMENCTLGPDYWYTATKDILPGNELLTHYGPEFWCHKAIVQSKSPRDKFQYCIYLESLMPGRLFSPMNFYQYSRDTLNAFLVDFCGFKSVPGPRHSVTEAYLDLFGLL